MKIHSDLKRKDIAKRIGELLDLDVKYLGVPSFAYKIGDYILDKDMNFDCENQVALKLVEEAFKSTNENEEITTSISMPLDFYDRKTLCNLKNLIQAKAPLLKKALQTEKLEVIEEDDRLTFPWFKEIEEEDHFKAYSQLIAGMSKIAKERQKISIREVQTDNEKYAFRIFLLSIGFIGEEYKRARKILLENLSGNSAYRRGAKMNKKILETLRKEYPKGTRVRLLKMNDDYAPPIGTLGTVESIDDIGSIKVFWDNGSSLSVLYGEDEVEKAEILTENIKEQILKVRDTGRTNMFDVLNVQKIANEMGFYELIIFIKEHPKEYSNFILKGKTN